MQRDGPEEIPDQVCVLRGMTQEKRDIGNVPEDWTRGTKFLKMSTCSGGGLAKRNPPYKRGWSGPRPCVGLQTSQSWSSAIQ